LPVHSHSKSDNKK